MSAVIQGLDRDYESQKESAQSERGGVLPPARRKDQNKISSFDERGETRDAKWHDEKAQDLPTIETRASARGADDQRDSNDSGEPNGGQPKLGVRIKIANREKEIPEEITPEDCPSSRKIREISHRRGRSILVDDTRCLFFVTIGENKPDAALSWHKPDRPSSESATFWRPTSRDFFLRRPFVASNLQREAIP
jgi:hypothetical protein